MFTTYLVVDVLAVAVATWLVLKMLRKNNQHFPPGPKGLPIVGNVLDMPSSQEWVTYSQWNDRWGW